MIKPFILFDGLYFIFKTKLRFSLSEKRKMVNRKR